MENAERPREVLGIVILLLVSFPFIKKKARIRVLIVNKQPFHTSLMCFSPQLLGTKVIRGLELTLLLLLLSYRSLGKVIKPSLLAEISPL